MLKLLKNRFFIISTLLVGVGLVSVYGIWSGSASHYANLSDGVTVSKWNGFLGEFASVFGWTGADMLEAQTGDVLTHTKRNSLVDKVETYTNIPDCNSDNGGNCKITQTNKSLLDADLIAANIMTGKNIFGVNGTMVGGNSYCQVFNNSSPFIWNHLFDTSKCYISSPNLPSLCSNIRIGGSNPTGVQVSAQAICNQYGFQLDSYAVHNDPGTYSHPCRNGSAWSCCTSTYFLQWFKCKP